MSEIKLRNCPICNKEVSIVQRGYNDTFNYWCVTRGLNENKDLNCKCRLFMESKLFETSDEDDKEKKKQGLIKIWNTRNGIDESYENGCIDTELKCEQEFDKKISMIIDKLNEQITSFSKKDTIKYIRHKAYLEKIIEMIKECAE